MPFVDGEFGAIVGDWFAKADEILLGRTTYAMMQAFWSQITDPGDVVRDPALSGLALIAPALTMLERAEEAGDRLDGATRCIQVPGGCGAEHAAAQVTPPSRCRGG